MAQVLANLIDIGSINFSSRNTGISTPRLVLPVLLLFPLRDLAGNSELLKRGKVVDFGPRALDSSI